GGEARRASRRDDRRPVTRGGPCTNSRIYHKRSHAVEAYAQRRFSLPAPVFCCVSVHSHRASAPASINCAVLTISDTRTPETDKGGDALVRLLTEAGHAVRSRGLVPDEPARVQAWIQVQRSRDDVQA